MNESLTYAAYDDAVDVAPRYTNAQIEAALTAGEFLFTPSNNRAVVEQDINTFLSYTPKKNKSFHKNRVIRVMDGIANDLKRIFEASYIGKVDNNVDGRALFRKEIVVYLMHYRGLQQSRTLMLRRISRCCREWILMQSLLRLTFSQWIPSKKSI